MTVILMLALGFSTPHPVTTMPPTAISALVGSVDTLACADPKSEHTLRALQFIRRLAAVPRRSKIRRIAGFEKVDSNEVVQNLDEAKCRQVLKLVRESGKDFAETSKPIFLARVGSKYYGRVLGLRVAGDDLQFVLDDDLKRIVKTF